MRSEKTLDLRWITATVLGATLALLVNACEGEPAFASSPKTLATGVVSAAEHEAQFGFYNIGRFSISVPPAGIPADILREHLGQTVRITVERLDPKTLQRIDR